MSRALRYWEDFVVGFEYFRGPIRIDSEDVEQYLALSRETHLIHTDDAFARSVGWPGRIVPGGLIHLKAGAEVRSAFGATAFLALRSMHCDFLSALTMGEPFFVTARISGKEAVDECRGIMEYTQRVSSIREPFYLGIRRIRTGLLV